jgi:hypothetical protein
MRVETLELRSKTRVAVNKLWRKCGIAIVAGGLGLAAAAALTLGRPVEAQTDGWSTPQLIFEGRGSINAPALVADAFGQVHAFWMFQQDQQTSDTAQQQIYYTRLDRPTWPVNDIFIGAPTALSIKAVMTSRGLALLWGGNNLATASSSPQASAQDWTGPMGTEPAFPESGLTVAPDGSLWMIYGATASNEIYVQHQNPDNGRWEAPLLVGDPVNTNAAPDATRLAFSSDGTMHAVWTEYQMPLGWPPVGLYYAQSADGGHTWTNRLKIAGPNYNQPNVATGPNGQVYLAWTGIAGIGDKHFEESLDDGRTWENDTILMPGPSGGSEGAPNMAVDSAGNLHVVFSQAGCVWHMSREANVWSTPECVSAGAPSPAVIESPAMALGLGDQLYVMFWTDRRQLWVTSRLLATAAQPTEAVPTVPTPTLAPTSVPPTAAPTSTPLPDFGPPPQPEQATAPGFWALGAGVAPVVLLTLLVAIFRKPFRR